MDILKYFDFKDDVKRFLLDVIKKYDLQFSDHILDLLKEPRQHYVCLKNDHIVLTLNYVETFPYPDVVPHFYFFGKNLFFKLDDNHVRPLLKIEEEIFTKYCLGRSETLGKKDFFFNSEKGSFLYAIKSINDTILDFYHPLFEGKVTKKDYDEFLKNLS